MKNQIIITLGREHGSGGHYIADMIAQELGIKLYDKDSIEKEIVSEGYSEEMIRKMDEKPVNFFASRRIGKYSNSTWRKRRSPCCVTRQQTARASSSSAAAATRCSRATPIC